MLKTEESEDLKRNTGSSMATVFAGSNEPKTAKCTKMSRYSGRSWHPVRLGFLDPTCTPQPDNGTQLPRDRSRPPLALQGQDNLELYRGEPLPHGPFGELSLNGSLCLLRSCSYLFICYSTTLSQESRPIFLLYQFWICCPFFLVPLPFPTNPRESRVKYLMIEA